MKIKVWSFGIRSQGLGFLSICGPWDVFWERIHVGSV